MHTEVTYRPNAKKLEKIRFIRLGSFHSVVKKRLGSVEIAFPNLDLQLGFLGSVALKMSLHC